MADERTDGMDVAGVLHSGGTGEPPKDMQTGIGLAVASLTLGLLSLTLSVLVVGAAAGLVGLILGAVHLAKGLPFRATAIWGLVLSIIGGTAGVGFGVLYGIGAYSSFKAMAKQQDEGFADFYGTTAPDVSFKAIDGNEIRLADLKGKRVMLDFWATWCPPCKKEIPHIVELRKTISPEKLVIIGISDEPAEVIRTFAKKQKMNYPVASVESKELPMPFSGVVSLPTVFFIDANGVIEGALSGYQPLEKLKNHALGLATTEQEGAVKGPGEL